MPIRTDADLVKGVLLGEYDADGSPDLGPRIAAASSLTDRVAACAVERGVAVSDADLTLIETWLAAHFYQQTDKGYSARTTEGASGTFQGQWAMRLESTSYGQTAMLLDPSGCLTKFNLSKRARMTWLGKPPSEQIAVEDRD